MDTDTAKCLIVKYVLQQFADPTRQGGWWARKDLFNPSQWDDRKVADVAAQKNWQKGILYLLEQTKVIVSIEKEDGGKMIPGYRSLDRGCALQMSQEAEAIWWLIAPDEMVIPDWIGKRMPARTDPTPALQPAESEMSDFELLLRDIAAHLNEIKATNRRIEDRVNKFELKASEARDKTLQLVLSTVSDMRQCVSEWRSMLDEFATLMLDAANKREQFLIDVEARNASLATTLCVEHNELVCSLELHKRYQEMLSQINSYTAAMQAMRGAMEPMARAAGSLEAGVETAMELARSIEEQGNVAR